ncbi:hypothetical protein KKA47_03505 [bacterium]|nr:hypothetical protein [bacterium]
MVSLVKSMLSSPSNIINSIERALPAMGLINPQGLKEVGSILFESSTPTTKTERMAKFIAGHAVSEAKEKLLQSAEQADRKGNHHISAAIYEELGEDASACYRHRLAIKKGIDVSRHQFAISQYYSKRGRDAKALDHLLLAARAETSIQRKIHYLDMINNNLHFSNWDDSYKGKVRRELRIAEAQQILEKNGVRKSSLEVSKLLKERMGINDISRAEIVSIKMEAYLYLSHVGKEDLRGQADLVLEMMKKDRVHEVDVASYSADKLTNK